MWTEKRKYWLSGLAMILLGMIFVVAAMGKLIAGAAVFELLSFPLFVPQALAEAIYISLPYIELAAGSLLLLGIAIKFAVSLSALLVIGFAISNILMVNLGVSECANCFGGTGSLTPASALLLDGVMAALVIVISLCYRGSFFNRIPWFLEGECEYV